MKNIFQIDAPAHSIPLIFDSAHSGHVYPADFHYACGFDALERAEDNFVDLLYESAPLHGATLLRALFPRSYIDANRAVDDIDPGLIDGPWPYGSINPTARSDAGIGLIRRLVRPGVPVYNGFVPTADIKRRITLYYEPYHAALSDLLNTAHYNFGQVWHINCHSMPSVSARPRQAFAMDGNQSRAADFVLGNRDGTTCDLSFTHAVRDFLRDLGYHVSINDPFKGAELIERYSNPARQRHGLQIEVNKALYMDEATNLKSENFTGLQKDIERLIGFCAAFVQAQLIDLAAD